MIRGRPNKDTGEKFRVLVWYYKLRDISGWSDYRLDIEFGYKDTPGDVDGQSRPRIFEEIRKNGRTPTKGTHPKRNFDLLERVGTHPELGRSLEINNSTFWELVASDPLDVIGTHSLVTRSLDQYGIKRLSMMQEAHLQHISRGIHTASPYAQVTGHKKYNLWLKVIIENNPVSLDLLALIGSLYREAYLSGNIRIALVLYEHFVALLNDYTEMPWLKPIAHDFHLFAETRVLYPQQESETWRSVYDDYPLAIVEGVLIQNQPELIKYLENNEDAFLNKLRDSTSES